VVRASHVLLNQTVEIIRAVRTTPVNPRSMRDWQHSPTEFHFRGSAYAAGRAADSVVHTCASVSTVTSQSRSGIGNANVERLSSFFLGPNVKRPPDLRRLCGTGAGSWSTTALMRGGRSPRAVAGRQRSVLGRYPTATTPVIGSLPNQWPARSSLSGCQPQSGKFISAAVVDVSSLARLC
jgi:hypothetical protein